MTLEEQIRVQNAYSSGKPIQVKCHGIGECGWHDCINPIGWDFILFEYRVKPSKWLRPFRTKKEAMELIEGHGMLLHNILNGNDYTITMISGEGVGIMNKKISYYDAFYQYTFADGTPFGVKED